jgi:mRNA-degrading endonuclease RelE of RelBE toxin-antitoxin system
MTPRKPSRPTARPRAAAKARAAELPPPDFDAPLHELDRDALSVFLYLALMPEETAQLVRDLDLSQPGFRQEKLGEVQRCDLLADEIRASPERRAPVLAMLRKGWERPVLAAWPLAPDPAVDLLDACAGDGALALALWRVLCDPAPQTRAQAVPFLERLAAHHYGPPQEGARREAASDEDPAARLARERDDLRRKLEEALLARDRAEGRAESVRKKTDEAREKLQAWLKEARAREAQAVDEAARARAAAEEAQRERARAERDLAAARAEESAVEAHRLRGALRDAEARANALESRLARSQERERSLELELDRLRASAAQPAAAPAADAGGADAEPEEAPASWLTPVYTREFYDSLEGWDRRIQRAAFKQAALLAQDHRHPSLRALPLEGLPGYYRVRVATDVRLIYRRAERQNTVEILSLIDREDLDRYIKQAKTRAG